MTTDALTRDAPTSNAHPAARAGSPVKVLVFFGSLRVGGAESMSVALANALVAEGLSVLFAAERGPLGKNLGARV